MMLLFAIRPGGFDGGCGRGQMLSEVLGWTLPQLAFFCFGDKLAKNGIAAGGGLSGEELKADVDRRYSEDPQFREQYQRSVKEAIRRAKESLR